MKENNRIRVHVSLDNKEFVGASVEALDLGTRSLNSLRRNGIMTVGDLVKRLSDLDSVMHIGRNIGATSAKEIRTALMTFYLQCLGAEKVGAYVEYVKAHQRDPEYIPGNIIATPKF